MSVWMVSSTAAMMSSWKGRFFQIWMASTFQPNLSFSMRIGRSMIPAYMSATVQHAVEGEHVEDQESGDQSGDEERDLTIEPIDLAAEALAPQEQRQRIGEEQRAEGAADPDLEREEERVEEGAVEQRQPEFAGQPQLADERVEPDDSAATSSR